MALKMAARKPTDSTPQRLCAEAGCHKQARTKGLCDTHYQRTRRPTKRAHAKIRIYGDAHLVATRVSGFAAEVLQRVASERGQAVYTLHNEILEKWAQEQVVGKIAD